MKPGDERAHPYRCRIDRVVRVKRKGPGTPGYQVTLMRRSFVLIGSLLLVPTMLHAQGHGGMGGGGMAMGHGGGFAMGHGGGFATPHAVTVARGGAPAAHFSGGTRMVSRVGSSRVRLGPGPVRGTRRPRGGSSTTSSDAFNRSFDFNDDELGAPGLGFDEVHNQAVHPNRRRRNDFGGFFPFFDGGFFIPSTPFVDETGGEAPPPEEVAPEEAPEPPHARTHYREPEPQPPAASNEIAAEPQAKTEEYVFVRRDGTLFFAVAYTWDNGTLRYITSEGVRRSVTSDTLDLGATQQFNEQRGMSFHLPA